jgi:hypothetical protein
VKTRTKNLTIAAIGTVLLFAASACDPNSDSQTTSQSLSNTYTNSATKTVPYPLNDMQAGGWTERTMLKEHLERQNNAKALRYITFITQQGQVVATYPVQGMVFDPNSQMTTNQIVNGCNSGGNGCGAVTQAAGDNGTWGPEAGAAAFFTTSGVEIQVPASMTWIESDAPLNLTTKPLITYDASAAPSVSAGGVKVGGH